MFRDLQVVCSPKKRQCHLPEQENKPKSRNYKKTAHAAFSPSSSQKDALDTPRSTGSQGVFPCKECARERGREEERQREKEREGRRGKEGERKDREQDGVRKRRREREGEREGEKKEKEEEGGKERGGRRAGEGRSCTTEDCCLWSTSRVFDKIKSRNAHMKRHRLQEQMEPMIKIKWPIKHLKNEPKKEEKNLDMDFLQWISLYPAASLTKVT
ncbi:Zinc finger protein, partial [Ophiophagus hannah]